MTNGPAPVTFTVERSARGKKRGKACVAPPRRGNYQRCTRYVAVKGSFKTTGKSGPNRLAWNGKVGGKALKKGTYRLVAVAKTSSDSSQVVRTSFRVR